MNSVTLSHDGGSIAQAVLGRKRTAPHTIKHKVLNFHNACLYNAKVS